MNKRTWLKRVTLSLTATTVALSSLFSPAVISAEKLKWAHVYETSTPYHKWAVWAAEEIGKRSNGKFDVQVFPAASLGKENEINESLSLGTIDIIYTGSTFVGRSYGPLAIPSAPFMLRNFDHFNAYANSSLFADLSNGYKSVTGHNIQSLTYYGQRMVTSNTPVSKPADMKDMKLRVPPAPLFQMFTDSVEANATPIAFSEVYLALSQGVVDGQENPLPTIQAKKFYEVQKYINLTGHIIDSLVTVVGGPTWNKLSDSDKSMFKKVFVEASAGASNDIRQSEKDLVAWFVEQGVNINTDIDRNAFRKAAMSVHNGKHASWSEEVYKRFQEL
ncbi:sialic acid TRAP transporter substrate-binding protein SiaP [Vibrio penaeicida]|uniref:ABC transporter substrate-binding protein n=1 Tax=Vibrio penaeicida TaxID=104609 RepID=A0AAV5NUM4_9VIBR|nr:sialic acid TRAP transporter substrate-binding protein SiaP [Vibrio penaeicida]RTZ22792.1 ABC transporter substrate-binding protein [Vibrio penaeicida]GLQ74259.1 ABC transporter substrate-binding protein [Vibrio penaeicida]